MLQVVVVKESNRKTGLDTNTIVPYILVSSTVQLLAGLIDNCNLLEPNSGHYLKFHHHRDRESKDCMQSLQSARALFSISSDFLIVHHPHIMCAECRWFLVVDNVYPLTRL